jgi:hypothetical protein
MQERRSRRAVAAFTAAVLILAGWLSAHHEADVAHVRDGTGRVVHAQELADHHVPDTAAHLHGRAEHQHAPGACALLATLFARPAVAPAISVTVDAAIVSEILPATDAIPAAIAAYRLAPKTSPPARA